VCWASIAISCLGLLRRSHWSLSLRTRLARRHLLRRTLTLLAQADTRTRPPPPPVLLPATCIPLCQTQIPLKLAWAFTVHKSQYMTLSRAELMLHDAFAAGQVRGEGRGQCGGKLLLAAEGEWGVNGLQGTGGG
jgi:hypothetical protein